MSAASPVCHKADPNAASILGRTALRGLLLCLASLLPALAWAGGPVFSHMTLNGVAGVALSIEDVVPELASYGVTTASIRAKAAQKLESAGLPVIDEARAVEDPAVALLRVRIITNRNAQGFYHLSVKLELRKKIPLGNPAGGFISEAIWSSADNGVMLASETEKIDALLDRQLAVFLADHGDQNHRQSANDSKLTLGNVYECPTDPVHAGTTARKPAIELFVNEPWLSAIRDGRKRVEGRAGTLETYAGWIGQQVRLCSDEGEVIVKVLAVHHYDTLSAFLDAEGWQNAAPHLGSREETAAKYLEFYPGDFIDRHGGMNGIIIEVAPIPPQP